MNMVEKIVFEPLADSHREAVIRIFNHYVMNGTAAFSDAELPESFYPHILERERLSGVCRGGLPDRGSSGLLLPECV